MKIGRIEKEKSPVQVRLSVPATIHECLGQYVSYYQHVHGDDADLKAIMIEMLRSVLDSDREFQHWLKTHATKASTSTSSDAASSTRRSQPASTDASVKSQVHA
ncbi:MAG TPA: DUF2274 domain-containing protein [Candidatus Binataceae bacterium]|nr:DUF2274 domain-containing protein [Candidatus Binataceae bacterium]